MGNSVEQSTDYERGFRDGVREGVRAALAFFPEVWRDAVGHASKNLEEFKSSQPEFYAHAREEMARISEAKAAEANVHPGEALALLAQAEALRRDRTRDETAVLAQLSESRRRELATKGRDAELVASLAQLIESGHVTKTAAVELGIGLDAAKRIRALAVELGLLPRRPKK